MNPRRLHSDTIFSIKGVSFGSAMRRAVFLKHRLMSREARNGSGTVRWGKAHEPSGTSNIEHPTPNIEWQRDSSLTSAFSVRCWMFDVFPRFRGSKCENFRGILHEPAPSPRPSPPMGERVVQQSRDRLRW